ncbi:MAG: DUF2117 domain-containing protein [Euryarchaeota archaeon]|nr:DUF2117 domain-containing protein [Euryarchaeota archaeon]
MRFGVVIHGPEVIDSGVALRVLDELGKVGEVEATIGGAMGTAALLDAGLEDRVAVRGRQLVSDAIAEMDGRCDEVILLNAAKTPASGQAFGQMVVSRVFQRLNGPVVQIDDGFYIKWKGPISHEVVSLIRSMDLLEAPRSVLPECSTHRRVISGVEIGENLWIDGTVVGKVIDEVVEVRLIRGELVFSGLEPKDHGLAKLDIQDLSTAIIRSGSVRRTKGTNRAARSNGDRVLLIDHCAENALFRGRDLKAAVSIGDDTTRIATSLLARLGVPVIGIVDGDEDGICADRSAAEGSRRLVLHPSNDDRVGAMVREKIFQGRDEMKYEGTVSELAEEIRELAESALIEVTQ